MVDDGKVLGGGGINLNTCPFDVSVAAAPDVLEGGGGITRNTCPFAVSTVAVAEDAEGLPALAACGERAEVVGAWKTASGCPGNGS